MKSWSYPFHKMDAIDMERTASGVWVQRPRWDVFVENQEGQFDFIGTTDRIVYGVDYGSYDFYQDSDGRVIICDSEKNFHHNCDHDKKGQR